MAVYPFGEGALEMDANYFIRQLKNNSDRIKLLVKGVRSDEAVWKPDPVSWSILEVVNHLYDEEKEDFRVRLDITLHTPQDPWPTIDPEGWVTENNYNLRALEPSIRGFLDERRASLAWLSKLDEPAWNLAYEAPFGPIRAGDLLAAWTAHDLLHMRQLIELHYAYTAFMARPYYLVYAGAW